MLGKAMSFQTFQTTKSTSGWLHRRAYWAFISVALVTSNLIATTVASPVNLSDASKSLGSSQDSLTTSPVFQTATPSSPPHPSQPSLEDSNSPSNQSSLTSTSTSGLPSRQQKTLSNQQNKYFNEIPAIFPKHRTGVVKRDGHQPMDAKSQATDDRVSAKIRKSRSRNQLPNVGEQRNKNLSHPHSTTTTTTTTDSISSITKSDNEDYIESNLLPTASYKPETIYERNVIPNVRRSRTFLPASIDPLLHSTTPSMEKRDDEHLNANAIINKALDDAATESNFTVNVVGQAHPEINDIGVYDYEAGEKKSNAQDYTMNSLLNTTLLAVQLSHEDHSLIVTWELLKNVSQITGFAVSYKMEGREDYDSSSLRKQVRKFILHSLHEDKEYNICVLALVNGRSILSEECVQWSLASNKMYIGIIAGLTFLVPCIFVLLYILYKDKKVRHKVKCNIQHALQKERETETYLIETRHANNSHELKPSN